MPTDRDLFQSALDIADPAARAEYLSANAPDAKQLARVERLLAAHVAAGGFLEQPPEDIHLTRSAVDLAATRTGSVDTAEHAEPSVEQAGEIIAGKYKLLQQIGEGGMGSVWMADQTEPVKRRVAVKLIRVDRGSSKTILSRFEAERQAIALMDHPHIAKLLDAGTTDAGQPYFVMELVKGIPLTDYCDAHKLSIPDRLNLFIQICSAVQHAHQKGIIHRDLKPTNILVESHDDKAVPKVIDFGLAKATSGMQLTEQTLFTAFGTVMGTPLYMAPEQAKFNAVDVDTRADVFALGVILYELLTGTTPIARDSLKKAALDEMLRLIREQEAPTPSSRLSSADNSPNVAANRQMEPIKLGRFVKGELDWIVMKSLSKERDRRYETANGFARDIERFLNHEPVQAGPPSASYRLRKFVRRNRPQLVAGALVMLTLVLGVIGTTIGLVREARQREIAEGNEGKALLAAEEERKAKERESERAEGERKARDAAEEATKAEKEVRLEEERQHKYAQAIADFVCDDFLALTSVEGQGRFGGESLDRNATLLELLERAAAKLSMRKDLDPRTEAALCWIVGVNYRGVGEFAKSVPFLERAVELRRRVIGPDHPETLNAVNSLAVANDAAGRLDLALPLLEETLRLKKARLGPEHIDTLQSMNSMATAYRLAGKLELALPLFEETLRLRKSKLGSDHPDTLRTMNNLATCYRVARKLDLALPLYEETLRLKKAKLGPEHPETLQNMSGLAICYAAAGKLDLAVTLSEETLRLMKAKLGSDHPDTLLSMGNLGAVYRAVGKLDLALPMLEETVRLSKSKLGPDHPDTLICTDNLAMGYRTVGKFDLALPLFEETLRRMKSKFGPDHPDTLICMNNLAGCYKAAGKLGMAQLLWEETLRLMRSKLGPDHLDTLACMNNLAASYWSTGHLDRSVPLFEETLKLKEKKQGRRHPDTLRTAANLGVNYKDAGRLKEAILLLEEAYGGSQTNPSLRWVGSQLLDGYLRTGREQDAGKLVRELLAETRKQFSKESPELVGQLAQFSFALLNSGAFSEAEPLLRECVAIRETKEPGVWTTFNSKSMLGGALLGQKKYADAEPVLLAGYEGMKQREKTIPPQGNNRIPEAIDRLIELYSATNNPAEVKKWQAERAKYLFIAPMPREKK